MIKYWMMGKPLKVITHGWLGSNEDDKGVFAIKSGIDNRKIKIIIINLQFYRIGIGIYLLLLFVIE